MDADPDIDVLTPCEAWTAAVPEAPVLCRRVAAKAFRAGAGSSPLLAPGLAAAGAEMSITLGDDALARRLNREYRGQDKPTNVLSFAALDDGEMFPEEDPQPVMLGDIVVAFETTSAEAEAEGIPLAHHLSHLVAHGVLHLLGYDHEDDDAADLMEGLETAILAGLGVPDPYSDAHTDDNMRTPAKK